MSDTVEQIKSRLDIVDVISGYLKLQKAGRNHKARCPFHTEKTPSFHVSPERQSWHCFGCNKGGDMLSFVQEIEGIEFPEALRILAERAGVQVETHRPEHVGMKSQRQVLLAVSELAAKFFEKQLWNGKAGAKALAYLRSRGLTDDTIRAWRLGWAPNDWRALTGFLQQQEIANANIVASGMAIDKEGRPYDRFRSRIMFPITDANGQVIGFTGRVFGAEVSVGGEPLAKYVNTPQTALYDKSKTLYGLEKARLPMRSQDSCLLVEGNMDAIMSWQAGTKHVVATSGTALTPQQLHMLGRYTTNLSFCFDTDKAGKAATRRGIGLALAQNFAVKILAIRDDECKDPADYVQKYGEKWNIVAASAKPALQYYYDDATTDFNPQSAEQKRSIVATLGPLIKQLASHVEREHWTGQIATLFRVDQKAVKADIAAVKDDLAAPESALEGEAIAANVDKELNIAEQEILALLVRKPSFAPKLAKMTSLLDTRVVSIASDPALLKPAYDGELRHFIDVAVIRANELWQDYTDVQLQEHFANLMHYLNERHVRSMRMDVEREIRQAEAAHDSPRLKKLVAQFQKYTSELNELQRTNHTNGT